MKQATRILLGAVLSTMFLASCSSDRSGSQRRLSEGQRDSTIAHSDLPGAGVVGKALEVSDSTAARVRSMKEEQ